MGKNIEQKQMMSNSYLTQIAAGRLILDEGTFELAADHPTKPRDVPHVPKDGTTYDGTYNPFDRKQQPTDAIARVARDTLVRNRLAAVVMHPPQAPYIVTIVGK